MSSDSIKEELQLYLDEKNLNSLFVTIVEAILTKKPQCPIDFMVNFLLDKYPNETSGIEKRFEKETPMSLVMAADVNNQDEEEELSESEDEDEGEEVLPVEEERSQSKESSNPRPKKRRESICAEKLSDKCDSDLKVIEKSESELARISILMRNNMFFSHLDEQQMKAIQDTMFLTEHVDGDVIIRQGDEDGDKFYCIDSGLVDIFINEGEERKLVKSCEAGDSFGELALLYGAPRAASCIASGDVRLWTLDRLSFKKILMKTTIDVRTVNKSFLENVPLFSSLDEYEVLTISDALHEESFEDSQTVLTEGEAGDKFYLIKEGNVVCTKLQSDGSVKEVKRLTSGEYFGELALLTEKPRQATITAEGKLSCLSINRETFNRLVCMKELLVRNMGTYNI
eukprot:CAMPEP_0201717114 /NCGR_PEP_ID=MMETSP0593-20130828/2925_1 /ASSEMBLY_ACC=CAM_ASM_000672 /TAXON_ID=267983 /ORGANISM="Skeletonema japonicum, Strain CCMP2506" /LENGTH=397 /DNA_ID=CAMNT_0048207081 /DNA_START=82 /DNA_END=1275 /DNA_ORIENTATION=+